MFFLFFIIDDMECITKPESKYKNTYKPKTLIVKLKKITFC